ncbi:MAG: TetR/AcrR family transcriptional regulator [bacterium]
MTTENKQEKSTEERLLEAATSEFAENGLAGARVDRIAKRAGVNKAMLYYHFQSKEKLYRAVINKHIGQVANAVGSMLSEVNSLEQALLTLANAYAAMFAQSPEFVPMALRELASGGYRVRAAVEQIFQPAGIPRKLKALLEEGIAQGRYRDVDPVQTIVSFVGMNLFYLILWPLVHSLWDVKDEEKFRSERPQQVVDLLLHGLVAR